MATTKKATENTAKPVTLTNDKGEKLVLDIDRDMVLRMEDEGYGSDVLADLMETKPNKGSIILTYYSMLKNKPDATIEDAKELYFTLGVKSGIVERLSSLYGYSATSLIDGDTKNVTWTMD